MYIDDGTLVEAVRSRREVYDKGHPGWKNAAIKDAAWAAIGEVLAAPANDCAARWHTLRERYNKEKRRLGLLSRSGSGGGSSVNIVWTHYEAMKFLEPFIRKRRGVSNLTVPSTATSTASSDSSPFFNDSGMFVVYDEEIENSESDLNTSVAAVQEGQIERPPENISSSESSVPATSSRPATPALLECLGNSQQRSTQQLRTPASQIQGRNIPAGAASLPCLGPTSSRARKRKNEVEATTFLRDTLKALSQSLSQPSPENAASSALQGNIDADSCIARNVETTLKSLPNHLKLIYRRKFRELLQECEEAPFNVQQEL